MGVVKMGATIKGFDDAYNGSEIQAYTVDKLSTAVVRVLNALAEDEEIFKLLYFEKDDSLGIDLVTSPQAQAIFTSKRILKNKDEEQRLAPYPFNPKVQSEHQAFIRVYFNQGSIDNAGFTSSTQVNIDIIVSHGLWLTADSKQKIKLIRPYAIMSRVIRVLESYGKKDKLPVPSGFTHLTVNEDFECIRIYANMLSTEKENLDTK